MEGDIFLQTLMRSFYLGSGSNIFLRRSVIDDIGFFDESFRRNQDLEYLVRVTKKYKMAHVDEVLLEIFYDIRTVRFTYEQSVEREQMFRKNFAAYLEELTEKEKRSVLIMYDLDWLRFLMTKKKIWRAFKHVIRSHIPMYVYSNYFKYVRDRKRNSSCYGFVVTLK